MNRGKRRGGDEGEGVPPVLETVRGYARVARDRLDWRDPDHHLGQPADRGTVARMLAYLFGSGGLLLLLTLALPGADGRESLALAFVAVTALGIATLLVAGFDRLPWWFLVITPSLGTVLVVLVICFGGPEASAAYAMYLAGP